MWVRSRSTPSAAAAIDRFDGGSSHIVDISPGWVVTLCTSPVYGPKSIILPGAAGNYGFVWILKLTLADGSVYTIAPRSGTIEGAATYTINDVVGPAVWFLADGSSNWSLIS